jgi:hypothetical protein
MQLPFMFIDFGNGLELVNNHANDVAALASFSIRWGTDSPFEQPEPSVLTFSLHDRSGSLAGKALTLAGARVIIQLATPPRWSDLTHDFGTWRRQTSTLSDLHQSYVPVAPDNPDSTLVTIFDGIVSTGGSITERRHGAWDMSLSATGRMVIWKRLQSQGPTDGSAKYKGLHWVGSPTSRFTELNARAAAVDAPPAEEGDLILPPSVAAYSTDYPSQLDLLHRLFSASSKLPLWYEVPEGAASKLQPTCLTDTVTITADTHATLSVPSESGSRESLNGGQVIGENTLKIPEPLTLVKINAKRVKANDGALEFDEADIDYSPTGLPSNLMATQSSQTVDSDVLVTDESAGVWTDGAMFTPTPADRSTIGDWILEQNLRLAPETITVAAEHLDPARFPWLYVTAPTGAFILTGTRFSKLSGSGNRPAFTGAWTSIGGTLSFSYSQQSPRLRHELTIFPLSTPQQQTKWSELSGWPPTWTQCRFTLAEMSMINTYEKEEKQ